VAKKVLPFSTTDEKDENDKALCLLSHLSLSSVVNYA
jgi:hypothetical protein